MKIIYVIAICLVVGMYLYIRSCSFFKTYDKIDLTENYDKHEKGITDLITYFDSVLPKNTYVHIEIVSNRNIKMLHFEQNGKYESNWDIGVNSAKADSIFAKLNWNKSVVRNIKSKLEDVNCISISNGNPHSIGFQRSVMSLFSYLVFDKPLNDSLKSKYNDNCINIFYRDNVVLNYGSGATGSICFPDRFKNNQNSKQQR